MEICNENVTIKKSKKVEPCLLEYREVKSGNNQLSHTTYLFN